VRIALLAATLLASSAWGATPNPIHWSCASVGNKPLHPGAKFTVKLLAQIDAGWHLYAADQDEGGPVALEISLPDHSALSLGSIRASKPVQLFDPNFNKRVHLYVDKAEFNVQLTVSPTAGIDDQHQALEVRYQSCNETMCLAPRKVSIDLPVTIEPANTTR
jgi:thiol:disulfide interchange protein DsbD